MSITTANSINTRELAPSAGYNPNVLVFNETCERLEENSKFLSITAQKGYGVETAVKNAARHHSHLFVEFNAATESLYKLKEILTNPQHAQTVLLVTNPKEASFLNKTKSESYQTLLEELNAANLKLTVLIEYEQ